jgi:hypothetical protein
MSDSHVVDDVFGQIESKASEVDALSVDDLLATFGRRVYGPVLFLVGVIAVSPLGAIPGASVLFATLVALLAAQYAARDGAPWLPAALRRRRVSASRAHGALERMRPYARRIEFLFAERATALTEAPWTWAWAAILIGLALTMYPLALVPGGVTAPAAVIALTGLSITARDGRALAVAGAIGAAVVVLALALML